MLSFEEKISYFENCLNKIEENYADSFKTDILFFFGEFIVTNQLLKFLKNLNSFDDIDKWINKLTSRIVMKEDLLEVNEIVFDYLEFG